MSKPIVENDTKYLDRINKRCSNFHLRLNDTKSRSQKEF